MRSQLSPSFWLIVVCVFIFLFFEKNQDILETIGFLKNKKQLLIGFAAETNDLIKNSKIKIKKKNLVILTI